MYFNVLAFKEINLSIYLYYSLYFNDIYLDELNYNYILIRKR